MAITRRSNGFIMDAAGDVVEEKILVRKMYILGGSANGEFVFKNRKGEMLIPTIDSSTGVDQEIDWPFGEYFIEGLEVDSLPTGGEVDVIFA